MVATWPSDFPGLGTGFNLLACRIGVMSGGRLTVRAYGGNGRGPSFEVFDPVQRGLSEMGRGVAFYWRAKIPAALFFAGIPLDLTGNEMNGFYFYAAIWSCIGKPTNHPASFPGRPWPRVPAPEASSRHEARGAADRCGAAGPR